MSEATSENANQAEDTHGSVSISSDDWKDFGSRQGGAGSGFFNDLGDGRGAQARREPDKPPDDGNGETGAEARKPDEGGTGDPSKEKPDGNGETGAEARKPDEGGTGDPSKEKPDGADDGKLPQGIAARLRRQTERHREELTKRDTEKQALEARIADLEARLDPDKKPPEGGGGEKEVKPPATAEEQYQALGLEKFGPDPTAYEDLDDWEHDFALFGEKKPLEKHPKLGELAKGGEKPEGKPEGKPTESAETEAQKLQAERAKRGNLAWETLDAAFEEADGNEESELSIDDYEAFIEAVDSNKVRCDLEMLEHLAASEDGPAMAKLMVDAPAKSKRIFAKPAGERGAALDAMLKRAQKGTEKGGGDNGKDGGKRILPDLPGGGSHSAQAKDPEKMSQEEYSAWREKQMEQDRAGGFFVH